MLIWADVKHCTAFGDRSIVELKLLAYSDVDVRRPSLIIKFIKSMSGSRVLNPIRF
ncbi:hypothetical protein CIPAW_09G064000 [Carya illinoinensis]|uniref:Uncharacterized protein n=1 Tax=Carya illinoinensis TaxID=32201 RepID=A0A8T1PJE7_CARIL|nr:hypothetical protein CIPAW_09G064000 [Carya illinoinensis]